MNLSWPLYPIWEGDDVVVLGGGPSVRSFPLALLKQSHVVGCNDAYLFGDSIVDVLVFGDMRWYQTHKSKPAFKAFAGPKITSHPHLKEEPGLLWCPRETSGFHRHAIGWNGNTGSAAINVALLLGAKRVLLVGFDMALDAKGQTNWHPNPLDHPTEEVHYKRYMEAMGKTAPMIAKNWPGVLILNLNPNSAMDTFPKVTVEEVFGCGV